ncbi:MAG TPA: hypothetical protein VMW52_04040, partial [Phycisphaerae bacterium]|nr:hypothetical protein [Phycisphaerae bacterium]
MRHDLRQSGRLFCARGFGRNYNTLSVALDLEEAVIEVCEEKTVSRVWAELKSTYRGAWSLGAEDVYHVVPGRRIRNRYLGGVLGADIGADDETLGLRIPYQADEFEVLATDKGNWLRVEAGGQDVPFEDGFSARRVEIVGDVG